MSEEALKKISISIEGDQLRAVVDPTIDLMNAISVHLGMDPLVVIAAMSWGIGHAMRQRGVVLDPKDALVVALPALVAGYTAAEREAQGAGGVRLS